MVKKKQTKQNIFTLLRSAITSLLTNREILFPFAIIAFIHLFFLEVLYFYPRYPLNIFFEPIIKAFWSEPYMHYPLNLILLPQLYHNQFLQGFLYIFVTSFFIALVIAIIYELNQGNKIKIGPLMKRIGGMYVHIVCIAALIFILIKLSFFLYGFLIKRAALIRSTTGLYYIVKRIVIDGAPYFNLIASVIISSLFAYTIPIMVIEKKKVFSALAENFKTLFSSPLTTFLIIFIPSLFITPLFLVKRLFAIENFWPEFSVLLIVISIFMIVFIDAIIYTMLTIFYLFKKEQTA